MGDVLSRILWGPTKENVLNLPYPLEGMVPRRRPRPGSMFDVAPSGTRDAWITGRDYTLGVDFRWITRMPQQSPYPEGSPWAGALGFQAFLDWCDDGNPFRFVPDVAWPAFYVEDCYLESPHSIVPELEEEDGSFRARGVIMHPTIDLALARDRGLMFEYVPGASLTDLGGTFARADAATCATYVDANGVIKTVAANVLRDGHYIGGVRHTLLEPSRTNLFINSEDLSGATLNNATVSVNADTAPDGTATMDRLVENTANGTHSFSRAITATADAQYAASAFVKAGPRTRVAIKLYDAPSNTHSVLQKFNLSTGVVDGAAVVVGTGAFARASITAVSGGYRIVLVGSVGSGVTSVRAEFMLLDGSGNPTYTGDGASYASWWGLQFEDNVTFETSYIRTTGSAATRAADDLRFSFLHIPQAMTTYAKFIELGSPNWVAIGGAAPRIMQIGAVTGIDPRLYMVKATGSDSYGFGHDPSAQVDSGADVNPALGDAIELRGVLQSNGSVICGASKNGAAEVVGATSSAAALAGAWSGTTINVGGLNGSGVSAIALQALRVAFGIRSLAQARSA